MNFKSGIKNFFIFTALIITFFAANFAANASDYQYKVLDPKYNPSAEKLIENQSAQITTLTGAQTQKGFDLGRFLAILAVISFPMFVISVAIKTFKQVTSPCYPKAEKNILKNKVSEPAIGNIKIPSQSTSPVTNSISKEQPIPTSTTKTNEVDTQSIQNGILEMFNNKIESEKHSTSPIENKNPMLLNTLKLTSNKGLCLVEYNQKYSLIGYVDENIFLLDQPETINNTEIRSRLSERVDNKDRYFVRIGNKYKSLVEVSDSDMSLLLEM